jgi:hypothetical protein
MSNLRSILAATVLVMALVIPAAALADDDERDDRGATLSSETVHLEGAAEWIFPSLNNNQCRAIPTRFGDISPNSNDRVAEITTKVKSNGSKQVDVFDVVTGTAVGNGSVSGTYIWIYENHAIYSVPPGAGPVKVSVRMNDRFRVIGNGLNFETGFDWRWRFPVADPSTFAPSPEFADLVFPDDDVHPANVSNFKVFSTLGDPLACDPL